MKLFLILIAALIHFNAAASSRVGHGGSAISPFSFAFDPDEVQPSGMGVKTSTDQLNNNSKLHLHFGGGTVTFERGPKLVSFSGSAGVPTSNDVAFDYCMLPSHALELSGNKLSLKTEISECQEHKKSGQAMAMPGKKYSRLIAVLTALNSSQISQEDAKELLAPDFNHEEIKRAVEFAILGLGGGLRFPTVAKIKLGKEEARVKGLISISRGRYLDIFSRSFTVSQDVRNRASALFESKCKAGGAGSIEASQCAVYAQTKSHSAFSDFLYSGWKEDGAEKRLEGFAGQLDTNGRSLLMGLATLACGIVENRVGSSGFSSGESFDRKRMKALFPLAIKLETNVNRVDRLGRTALFYALGAGCQDEADLLLKAGARMDLVDYNDVPLLHYAILGKSERQYSKLSALTPNRYLERTYENRLTLEYRQTNSGLLFSSLLPISSLAMAVNEGEGEALSLLLAKKPKIGANEEAKLLRSIVNKKNSSVIEAAVKSGMKFTAVRGQGEVFFPAKAILAQISTYPMEGRQRLTQLLEPISKASDKEAVRMCESSPQGLESCIVSAGLCGQISDSSRRDKCYLGRGECKEILDHGQRGLCERSSQFRYGGAPSPDSCEKSKMSIEGYDICTLGSGSAKEILERVRRLLGTRKGAEALLSEMRVRPDILKGRFEVEEAADLAVECVRSLTIYSLNQWDSSRVCQMVVELSSKSEPIREFFRKKLPKCETAGDPKECLAPAVYLQDSLPAESKTLSAIIARLCREKDPVACMTGISRNWIPPDESRQAAFTACEGLLTSQACSQFHRSMMTMSRNDAEFIKKLALKGEPRSVDFSFSGYSRIDLSKEEINQIVSALEVRCKEDISSCSTLSRLFQREGRRDDLSKLSQALFPRIDEECGRARNCQAFKELATNDEWKKKLNDFCAKGNASACGGFPGAIENPNEPKVTLEGAIECLKRSTAENNCALLLSRLGAAYRKENKLLPDSICNLSMSHECIVTLAEDRLTELALDPRRVKALEKACEPTRAPGACFWAAKHYSFYQPAKAEALFKRVCDPSKYERAPACEAQLKLVKAKKSKGRLKAFAQEMCKSPNSQVCGEATTSLIRLDPKTEGAKARSECLAGDQKKCGYYLNYLQLVDPVGATSFRTEICAKYKIHCPSVGGGMAYY